MWGKGDYECVYKLGLSFKYRYLTCKIKMCYYYYVLRFVLPKLRIAGSKKFSSEGKMRMSFAHDQPNSCDKHFRLPRMVP